MVLDRCEQPGNVRLHEPGVNELLVGIEGLKVDIERSDVLLFAPGNETVDSRTGVSGYHHIEERLPWAVDGYVRCPHGFHHTQLPRDIPQPRFRIHETMIAFEADDSPGMPMQPLVQPGDIERHRRQAHFLAG